MVLIIKRKTPEVETPPAPVQLTAPKPSPKPLPKPLPKPPPNALPKVLTDKEQIALNKSELLKQMEAPEAILPKPKVTLKFGGSKKVDEGEEPLTQRQQQKLVESGLMEPEAVKWPPCPIGTRVTITNSMFPWVKHWKPGDQGLVRQISQINSFNGDKSGRYLSHIIDIDMPLEANRKGGTAMLFRWEFEPSAAAQ